MATFAFQIAEVSTGVIISWEAVDLGNKQHFPVNVQAYQAGVFPEITDYLKGQGVNFDVVYRDPPDSVDAAGTWTYIRGRDTVLVHDISRTLARFSRG